MTTTPKLLAGLMAPSALAACAEDSGGGSTEAAQAPRPAARACLRAVKVTTNNADFVLLSESFSQAGTEVIVGVGPDRAHWRRIGHANGTTGGIDSLTVEGAA